MILNQFILSLAAAERNYLLIHAPADGFMTVEHVTITEDDLSDMDYFDAAGVESLEPGQSYRSDNGFTVVRLS